MTKDFDEWNELKKYLHEKKFTSYIHTREVWWCSLGLNIGYEEDGKNRLFERPVLIIRKFSNDSALIVPLTTRVKESRYYFKVRHNDQEFAAILSQVRLISTKRFNRLLYRMDMKIFNQIIESLKKLL